MPERPSDVMRHFADVTLLEKHTGFRPQIDISTGLDMYLKWFKEYLTNHKSALAEMQVENWVSHANKTVAARK
jgi:dTDP-D-glucose 4,6-dehydratase